MRRICHLREPRSGQAEPPGPVCATASGPEYAAHRRQRRPRDPAALAIHGLPWRRSSRRPFVEQDLPGEAGDRPHTATPPPRDKVVLALRSAVLSRMQQGQHRGRAQWQHHQCQRAARTDLEREGSIFQPSSDTEVILHLSALPPGNWHVGGRCAEAMLQLEGFFAGLPEAADHRIVARDLNGFRPLAMGQMERAGGEPAAVFASENLCAFDLIGAVYLKRRRRAGRDGDRRAKGYHARAPSPWCAILAQCVF